MPISVKISLCKITAASRLFQRNYYLPLLKPLSPRDAFLRKQLGKKVLASKIEHYIPVLQDHTHRYLKLSDRPKNFGKRKHAMDEDMKYMAPVFDDDLEEQLILKALMQKRKSKKCHFVYLVTYKNYMMVLPSQLESCIRYGDIIDVTVALSTDKIVVKLNDNQKITMGIKQFEGSGTLYWGEGATKKTEEQFHHHGKFTMGMAKLFEAKEQGAEEWELESIRLASKRKKKQKAEDTEDWKNMMQNTVENMDWDKFEEDAKNIVAEVDEPVQEENIPMAVNDLEKTINVNEKLKNAGEEILVQLPAVVEIPEVIRNLESGELCEIENVSGAKVTLNSGKECFIAGQMVTTDESSVFVPGQTVESESGELEYVPGMTVLMDNEPQLLPGLIMGEEDRPGMFLPGESTITADGQLTFEKTEEDKVDTPSVASEDEKEDQGLWNDEPEVPAIATPPKERTPTPPPPKRVVQIVEEHPASGPLDEYEQRCRHREEEERQRLRDREIQKQRKGEYQYESIKMSMRKLKKIEFDAPSDYRPQDPVQKSKRLQELENQVAAGTFFEENDRVKQIMEAARKSTRIARIQDAFRSGYYGPHEVD